MKRILLIIAILFVAGISFGAKCGVKPAPTPVEPKDTADCPAACEKLRELGCPEGQPLEDGTTCEKFCIDTQQSGHALRPSCVMDMTECKQINDCTKGSREVFE
jgi:hypothetical protein